MSESPSVQTPREMSSRLLMMKFMQRAVAGKGSSPTTPTTPRSTKHGTHGGGSDDDNLERPAKRRKTAAATPVGKAKIDRAAVEAALHEQETRRQAALEKHTVELGDTHWVLAAPASVATATPKRRAAQQTEEMIVVYVGYEDIDQRSGSGATRLDEDGRIRSANFKIKTEKTQQKQNDYNSDSDSDSDSESESGERIRNDKRMGGQDKKTGRRGTWATDKKRKKKSFSVSISAGGSR